MLNAVSILINVNNTKYTFLQTKCFLYLIWIKNNAELFDYSFRQLEPLSAKIFLFSQFNTFLYLDRGESSNPDGAPRMSYALALGFILLSFFNCGSNSKSEVKI